MKRASAVFALVAGLVLVAGSFVPAAASVSGTKVSRVYQCQSAGDCPTAIPSDSIVKDVILIQGSASSTFGLRRVRLFAAPHGSSSGTCIRDWESPSGSSFSYTWDTNSWPSSASGCPGSTNYGRALDNGIYDLWFYALENTTADSQNSSRFVIRVNNPPSTPQWAATPTKSGDLDRKPVVTLKWNGSPETGMLEYHFIRTNPDGTHSEYAVHASNPAADGCSKSGNTYTCYDDDFPNPGYGGDYGYSVVAYRESPSSSQQCALYSGGCVTSQASGVRAVSLAEPPPPTPTPTQSGSPSPGGGGSTPGTGGSPSGSPTANGTTTPGTANGNSASPPRVLGQHQDNSEFYQGTYKTILPYDQQKGFVTGSLPPTASSSPTDQPFASGALAAATTPDDSQTRRLFTSVAGGLLLLIGAAHIARVLRVTAH